MVWGAVEKDIFVYELVIARLRALGKVSTVCPPITHFHFGGNFEWVSIFNFSDSTLL